MPRRFLSQNRFTKYSVNDYSPGEVVLEFLDKKGATCFLEKKSESLFFVVSEGVPVARIENSDEIPGFFSIDGTKTFVIVTMWRRRIMTQCVNFLLDAGYVVQTAPGFAGPGQHFIRSFTSDRSTSTYCSCGSLSYISSDFFDRLHELWETDVPICIRRKDFD